jgi:hypothetical protein
MCLFMGSKRRGIFRYSVSADNRIRAHNLRMYVGTVTSLAFTDSRRQRRMDVVAVEGLGMIV